MNNNKEIARILTTITEEQWEAILTISKHVSAMPNVHKCIKSDSEYDENVNNMEDESELRFKVANLVRRIGVPPHILGYTYIQDAIMLVYEDEECIHNVVNGIYQTIAEKHGSTKTRVERGIKHAFYTAYNKGDLKILEKVFKSNGIQPANSYAIAMMVEYIKMHD